jgi:hypothetical protein
MRVSFGKPLEKKKICNIDVIATLNPEANKQINEAMSDAKCFLNKEEKYPSIQAKNRETAIELLQYGDSLIQLHYGSVQVSREYKDPLASCEQGEQKFEYTPLMKKIAYGEFVKRKYKMYSITNNVFKRTKSYKYKTTTVLDHGMHISSREASAIDSEILDLLKDIKQIKNLYHQRRLLLAAALLKVTIPRQSRGLSRVNRPRR